MTTLDGPDRTGLIRAFAIVQIVIGGLSGLCALVALPMMGAMASALPRGAESWILFAALLFYAVPAANLLTTGIGSVRLRPWARLATLISAGIWMVPGALMVVAMVAAMLTGPARDTGGIIIGLFFLVPFIIGLPLTLLIIYTRSGVRETFARHAELRAANQPPVQRP